MLSNRSFYRITVIALLTAVVFTFREAAATSLISRGDSVEAACASLPSRFSVHTKYVQEKGAWMIYTEDGPAGVDGGLIRLLSEDRACAK